jgi:hypothetical protein
MQVVDQAAQAMAVRRWASNLRLQGALVTAAALQHSADFLSHASVAKRKAAFAAITANMHCLFGMPTPFMNNSPHCTAMLNGRARYLPAATDFACRSGIF